MIDVGPTRPHHEYLGGSDVAAVLGVNPYSSALDVWCEKTRRLAKDVTIQMRLGSAFERPVCDAYAADTGRKLIYPGTLSDPRVKHRAATPDAIESNDLDVQVKLVGTTFFDWSDPIYGAESVPQYVQAQVQYEMHHIREVLGLPARAARVLMVHGTALTVYTVPRDDELISYMLEAVDRFWRDHVVLGRMPEVTETDADIIRRLHPRVVEPLRPATSEIEALAMKYEELGGEIAEIEKERARIANELRLLCADAEGYEGSFGKVTHREQRGRVNWKQVAAELGVTPELVAKHSGSPTRVLRVDVH